MTRFKNKDLKNNELYIALKQLQNKRSYDTFDRFIISKMGFEVTGKVDDALRRQAYKNFYSLIADRDQQQKNGLVSMALQSLSVIRYIVLLLHFSYRSKICRNG